MCETSYRSGQAGINQASKRALKEEYDRATHCYYDLWSIYSMLQLKLWASEFVQFQEIGEVGGKKGIAALRATVFKHLDDFNEFKFLGNNYTSLEALSL